MQNFVAYYRVSTNKQKSSGLGLDSQKDAVNKHVDSVNGNIIASYEDIESGNSNNRPALLTAIERCKLTNSVLIIAKLDRLSRNVAFLAQLMESNINFVCCDNPNANKLTIHILAAVAEEERRLISERTKAALRKAKERGIKLGNDNLPKSNAESACIARSGLIAKSRIFKTEIKNILSPVKYLSYTKQAAYLNSMQIKTRRKSLWSTTSISRLYKN